MASGGTIVIPGQAKGLSPEPMNTEASRAVADLAVLDPLPPVFMGSGLVASRRPGMTAGFEC
jgi:hypothetical protein